MPESYADQLASVRARKNIVFGDDFGVALGAVLARLDKLEENLAAEQHCVCSYCGERTMKAGLSDEEFNQAIKDHILDCDARPEKTLCNALLSITIPLGIAREVFKPGDLSGLTEAVDKRWREVMAMIPDWNVKELTTLRPVSEHDGEQCVIWWHLPICEPPYIGSPGTKNADGTPTDCTRLIEEGWLTHWSPLPRSQDLRTSDGAALQ